MREKLALIEPDLTDQGDGSQSLHGFTAGRAGEAACARCVAELTQAGEDFDRAFAERDYERFIGYFFDANTTGLGADGTVGMNRDAWGRILREYFDENQWKLTITPIKVVTQNCIAGQILEVAHFDSPQQQITFVHVTSWIRDHGEWKVVLQTEAGPLHDIDDLLAKVAAQTGGTDTTGQTGGTPAGTERR